MMLRFLNGLLAIFPQNYFWARIIINNRAIVLFWMILLTCSMSFLRGFSLGRYLESFLITLFPHYSQTLWSYCPKALSSKGLTLLERADKKQQTFKTLILSSFHHIRIVAFQKFFVRNAGIARYVIQKVLSTIGSGNTQNVSGYDSLQGGHTEIFCFLSSRGWPDGKCRYDK
jgi:hypothetical protein